MPQAVRKRQSLTDSLRCVLLFSRRKLSVILFRPLLAHQPENSHTQNDGTFHAEDNQQYRVFADDLHGFFGFFPAALGVLLDVRRIFVGLPVRLLRGRLYHGNRLRFDVFVYGF